MTRYRRCVLSHRAKVVAEIVSLLLLGGMIVTLLAQLVQRWPS